MYVAVSLGVLLTGRAHRRRRCAADHSAAARQAAVQDPQAQQAVLSADSPKQHNTSPEEHVQPNEPSGAPPARAHSSPPHTNTPSERSALNVTVAGGARRAQRASLHPACTQPSAAARPEAHRPPTLSIPSAPSPARSRRTSTATPRSLSPTRAPTLNSLARACHPSPLEPPTPRGMYIT